MRVLVCTVDTDPCPAANVSTLALVDVFDPSSLGITPATVLYVYSWGLASVLTLWLLGYAIGACITVLRKL